MIEVDRAPGIVFCRIFACMSVAIFLSFASSSPTPHLHLFFFLSSFCFPRKEKGVVHRVAILWIWCCPNTLLLTFVLCPCVTICILIFWLHFLLANYPAFPSIYLLRCSCIPFYSAGSIFQPSEHLVSHPFLGWPQAWRSVLSAGLPAGETLCWGSRPSQSLAALNGGGAVGLGGFRALPSQLPVAHAGQLCSVKPSQCPRSPRGPGGHTGYFPGKSGWVENGSDSDPAVRDAALQPV